MSGTDARAARPVVRARRGAAGPARDTHLESQRAGRSHGYPGRAPSGTRAQEARHPEGHTGHQSATVPRAARRREWAQRSASELLFREQIRGPILYSFLLIMCIQNSASVLKSQTHAVYEKNSIRVSNPILFISPILQFFIGLVKFALYMKVIRRMLDRLEDEQKSKLEQLQQIQVDSKYAFDSYRVSLVACYTRRLVDTHTSTVFVSLSNL